MYASSHAEDSIHVNGESTNISTTYANGSVVAWVTIGGIAAFRSAHGTLRKRLCVQYAPSGWVCQYP